MVVIITTTPRITRIVVHQSTSLWSLEALVESSYLVLPLLLLDLILLKGVIIRDVINTCGDTL
jgi:hypothetical protein